MRILTATLLLALAASAQTNRGRISGTVFDQSHSVIPTATVTLTITGTNEVRHTATSEAGAYSAQNLEPVTYRIEVEAPGFKKTVIESVKVDTASNATVDVTLEAGSVDTRVTVTAD